MREVYFSEMSQELAERRARKHVSSSQRHRLLTIFVKVFAMSRKRMARTNPAAAIKARRKAVLRLSWKGGKVEGRRERTQERRVS